MKLTDVQLVRKITDGLTAYQNILVEQVARGRTEDQSIIPTVTITFDELRKLTHRTRVRTAFLMKIVGLLEDEGLDVECDDMALIVSKPADDLITEFDSLRALERYVNELSKSA